MVAFRPLLRSSSTLLTVYRVVKCSGDIDLFRPRRLLGVAGEEGLERVQRVVAWSFRRPPRM
jgi:hypothetical protein